MLAFNCCEKDYTEVLLHAHALYRNTDKVKLLMQIDKEIQESLKEIHAVTE